MRYSMILTIRNWSAPLPPGARHVTQTNCVIAVVGPPRYDGRLLRCGISIQLMPQMGQARTSADVCGTSASLRDCVAKLQEKASPRNNRIVVHKFLNQHCALASALESILLVLAPK
jgi:hypothetical protein